METTNITLQKDIQLITSWMFNEEDMARNSFEAEVRDQIGYMGKVVMLATNLPSEHLEEFTADCSYKVPCSVWQHFKQQYLPKWVTKRFPVIYKTIQRDVVVTCKAVYPKLPSQFDGLDYKLSYTSDIYE